MPVSTRTSCCPWLLFVAALCVTLDVQAEDAARTSPEFHVALQYAVSAACPSALEFKEIVLGRLGYDPFRETAPDQVLVLISAADRALEGKLEWRDQSGQWAGDQLFPSRDGNCRNLLRAMAFSLAVQIQILATSRGPEGSASAPAPSHAQPSSIPQKQAVPPRVALAGPATAARAPRSASRAAPRAVFGMGAGAALAFGLSSVPVALARAFATVRWQHLQFELGANAGLPTTTRREDGAGFSQLALFATGAGCSAYDRYSGCLIANAGAVRIAGRDIDLPATHWASLLQAGIRLAIRQQLGENACVALHGDGLATLSRWTVTLDSVRVWKAPPLTGIVGFEISTVFP